jgi:hypothetical protein
VAVSRLQVFARNSRLRKKFVDGTSFEQMGGIVYGEEDRDVAVAGVKVYLTTFS